MVALLGQPYSTFADTLRDQSAAEAIYLSLVRSENPSRDALLEEGYPAELVDRSLSVLHFRQVIDASDVDDIVINPPEVALAAYAAQLERHARLARASLSAAQQAFEQRTENKAGPSDALDVRRLQGQAEITAAIEAIEERCRVSLRAVVLRGPRLDFLVSGQHHPAIETGDGPPILRQALIDADGLAEPGVQDEFAARVGLGYDIRSGRNLPYGMLIIDDEVAIIDTTSQDPSGEGSLLVRNPELVTMLSSWFQRVHSTAVPIAAGPESLHGFTARERQVLTLMAAGLPDAAIARRLELSQRTVERRVAAALVRLDATTRFQAGIKAARQGLL